MVAKPGQADQVESDSHDAADSAGSVYVFKGAVLNRDKRKPPSEIAERMELTLAEMDSFWKRMLELPKPDIILVGDSTWMDFRTALMSDQIEAFKRATNRAWFGLYKWLR